MRRSAALRHSLLRVLRDIRSRIPEPDVAVEASRSLVVEETDLEYVLRWTRRGQDESARVPVEALTFYRRGDQPGDTPSSSVDTTDVNRAQVARLVETIVHQPLPVAVRSRPADRALRRGGVGVWPWVVLAAFVIQGPQVNWLAAVVALSGLFVLERYWHVGLPCGALLVSGLAWMGWPMTAMCATVALAGVAVVSPRTDGRARLMAASVLGLISTLVALGFGHGGLSAVSAWGWWAIAAAAVPLAVGWFVGTNVFILQLAVPVLAAGLILDGAVAAGVTLIVANWVRMLGLGVWPELGLAQREARSSAGAQVAGAHMGVLARGALGLTCVGMTVYAAMFLFVGYRIVTFGYAYGAFEWILEGAARLAQGMPIYLNPDQAHPVVDIYPPGLMLLLVPLVKFAGLNYGLAHAVVLAGAVACGVVMVLLVRQATGSTFWGVFAAGVFGVLCFTSTNQSLWALSPNAFILLALLLMLYCLRAWERSGHGWWLVGLIALQCGAFYLKQTAMYYGVGVALYLVLTGRVRVAVIFAVASAGIAGGVFWLGNVVSNDMWSYYLIVIPTLSPIDWTKAGWFTWVQKGNIPLGVLMAGLVWLRVRGGWRRVLTPELVLLVVLAPLALLGFLRVGGGFNQFIECTALLAVAIGIGVAAQVRLPARRPDGVVVMASALVTTCMVIGLWRAPLTRVRYPDDTTRASADAVAEWVRQHRPNTVLTDSLESLAQAAMDTDITELCLGANFYNTGIYDTSRLQRDVADGRYDVILVYQAMRWDFLQQPLAEAYVCDRRWPYADSQVLLYVPIDRARRPLDSVAGR